MTISIGARFSGFNIQLKEPVTSNPGSQSQLKSLLQSQISDVLGVDRSGIEIVFSESDSDSTDLAEVKIDFQSTNYQGEVSIPNAWDWAYKVSAFENINFAEPRFFLLDLTGLKGTPPKNTQFPIETDKRTWHLEKTGVIDAWNAFFSDPSNSEPGEGVKIALPDTGYLFHPALKEIFYEKNFPDELAKDFVDPNNIWAGKNWQPGDIPDPNSFGHGVSTSALIFASHQGNNVPGIAPNAEPLFLRIARSDGKLFAPPLGEAINYAVKHNAHIISISMGGYPTIPVRRAILNALRKGIIVIASAGNDVPFTVWPGAYRQVIAVASSAVDGSIANRSAKGTRINIAAPGEYVWCAVSRNFNEHSFERRSGTSFATPIVAGIAALWLSRWGVDYLFNEKYKDRPELIPIVFNKLLREQCSTPECWDKEHWGAGIVNAFKLLNAKLPDIADLTNQELDVINGSDYPELDQGGVSTFNHLFEHVQSSKGLMELALAKLVGKPREELPEFLRQFGRELAFHFGINKSLYGLLENILSQVEQETDLITPSIETSLDEVRVQLKENASQALQENLF
jgi:serine protease